MLQPSHDSIRYKLNKQSLFHNEPNSPCSFDGDSMMSFDKQETMSDCFNETPVVINHKSKDDVDHKQNFVKKIPVVCLGTSSLQCYTESRCSTKASLSNTKNKTKPIKDKCEAQQFQKQGNLGRFFSSIGYLLCGRDTF